MRISGKVLRKKSFYLLVIEICVALALIYGIIFISISDNRLMISRYFSKKCRNYVQENYSKKLNDRLVDYSAEARRNGIEECENEEQVMEKVADRQLVRVRDNGHYIVDGLKHSYPYLTGDSKDLLNEIGKRFTDKIAAEGLQGSRFIITSMTRTTENKRLLRKTNGNLSVNTPHVNGNAFDISYARFDFNKRYITECDKWYLKEALAEVIWELRKEKRCWATYERSQGCFHVVSR